MMRSHFAAPCCLVATAVAGTLSIASEALAQTQPPAAPPAAAPTASGTLQPLPAPAPTTTALPGPVWPQQPPAPSAPVAQPGAAPYGPPGYPTPGYRPPAAGQPYPGYYPYPYQQPSIYGYPSQYLPATLPYEEGKPGPNGYRLESRARKGLVIAGATTFGASYFFTILAASAIADDSDDWDTTDDDDDESKALPLFLPVIGPFIGISSLDASPIGSAWLVLDGLAQGAGAAMLIAGLAYPTKRWIRNDLGVEWSVAPTRAGRDGGGLGLIGRF